MSAYTPEQIERELKLAKKYDEYDQKFVQAPIGDYHVENRRALVEIIEQIRAENERLNRLLGTADKTLSTAPMGAETPQ